MRIWKAQIIIVLENPNLNVIEVDFPLVPTYVIVFVAHMGMRLLERVHKTDLFRIT